MAGLPNVVIFALSLLGAILWLVLGLCFGCVVEKWDIKEIKADYKRMGFLKTLEKYFA